MKRIDFSNLKPGDIILTASNTATGRLIRLTTKGTVSHAMIYVQTGSIIDSTSEGVQSRNLQRMIFDEKENFYVFRTKTPLTDLQVRQVIDFARSQIGVRYSKMEAARTFWTRRKSRSNRQFCSRLVATSYAKTGIQIVPNEDYCSPEDLRRSSLLFELEHIEEKLTEQEATVWLNRPDPNDRMRQTHNYILSASRELDTSIEDFTSLTQYLVNHPESDDIVAKIYTDSGYLELYKPEYFDSIAHFDIGILESSTNTKTIEEIRTYCIQTIKEGYTGNLRFATTLAEYKRIQARHRRKTFNLLINLYEELVKLDQVRRETALQWLRSHFPADAATHLETIIPHSEIWLSIVEQVEPNLHALAKRTIAAGDIGGCSTCGDPARDYRLVNNAEAMPGVPSLRLCDDCVGIRRGYGEILEPF
ncbi:YiiX/YebB-like N1pC/P60 family cysteine hydrolase [Nitrospirillum pindoramense]|uniref:Permuted papain-like amidase YaeF/Yiix C92 family enzyme n=1 Tax=Nitrospirillum amazonense TaxID=28077 RepID=A0A560HII4_9PROT|nr:YiiX/YebB-like N1pC/P60 family cysteine hydrolase [Nitrospirillum amazonense]TWB45811.1 permuted papain-like amidase YaeF/Yiix C92 family enzyme [Nitrospirillum amazonense]